MRRFYALVRLLTVSLPDPAKAAEPREVDWWRVHREQPVPGRARTSRRRAVRRGTGPRRSPACTATSTASPKPRSARPRCTGSGRWTFPTSGSGRAATGQPAAPAGARGPGPPRCRPAGRRPSLVLQSRYDRCGSAGTGAGRHRRVAGGRRRPGGRRRAAADRGRRGPPRAVGAGRTARRAYTAKTYADLELLVADLPAQPQTLVLGPRRPTSSSPAAGTSRGGSPPSPPPGGSRSTSPRHPASTVRSPWR